MKHHSAFSDYAAQLRELIAASPAAGANGDFNRLALSLFSLQFAHNAPCRRFCESRKVTPKTVEQWWQIPALPAAAFKEFDLTSLSADERVRVFHSSGTTGVNPSRHFHDGESLALYEASLLPCFRAHLLPEGARFICLTPEPAGVPHSSLAHMFEVIHRELAPRHSLFGGSVLPDGSWSLDFAKILAALRDGVAANASILLSGTAFNFVHLLDALGDNQLSLRLPPGSRVMETGGYKGRSRSLPRAELHALITERLGIPPSHIICEYGMSELSSQAYDGVAGGPRTAGRVFQFPPWARAQIVSPETGREAGEGETGLIRVFDLANVRSVMAIQTEDLGVRHGAGFELLGRAVLAEPRGCSLMSL